MIDEQKKLDCTLPDCMFCNDIDPIQAVDFFLQENNAIESVFDPDSLQQARYAWEYLQTEEKLTGGVILKLHKILMLHQPLRPNERGYWRTIQVGVYKGGELIQEAPQWRLVTELIKNWLEMALHFNQVDHPAELIQKLHIQYEHIHPFVDGNGRTGRMLLNWQRLKAGLPLLIIHSENKQDYYKWF